MAQETQHVSIDGSDSPAMRPTTDRQRARGSACEPYPDPQRPGAFRVPVVSSKHSIEAIIDAADLEYVRGRNLNLTPGKAGREISGGSIVVRIDHVPHQLTRLILGIHDPGQLVAHVNGDRLDCRRENLVVRTRSESALARKQPEPLQPYPDPDRPGVWRLPLKSHVASREVLIDQVDLPVVEGRNWNWSTRTDDGRTDGYVVLATVGKQLPLHRLIMEVTDPRTRVSFINGDALDCRRENLAVLTLGQVASRSRKMETRAGRKCTSGFKGVCIDVERSKWVAQIGKGRVYLQLGRFETETDAARAYDAAARVLFGAHAHLNLPDELPGDQAMEAARAAVNAASRHARDARRRQRDNECCLRLAASRTTIGQPPPHVEGAMISRRTAQELFDVTPTVWRRWEKFRWVPAATDDDDARAMVRLDRIALLLNFCGIVALPYPDPQHPDVYRLPLAGETAEGREALIDADRVELVQTRRWRFAPSTFGRGGEVQTMIPTENMRLHYVVMGITSDKDLHIGHRNDNPLDCRRQNLVVRTLTDTAANRRKQATICGRPCTSQFKGVWHDKRRKRWIATIKKNRVQHRLGSFRDEIAAAQTYDDAARELFGEHARLNFPNGVDAWLEQQAQELKREAA